MFNMLLQQNLAFSISGETLSENRTRDSCKSGSGGLPGSPVNRQFEGPSTGIGICLEFSKLIIPVKCMAIRALNSAQLQCQFVSGCGSFVNSPNFQKDTLTIHSNVNVRTSALKGYVVTEVHDFTFLCLSCLIPHLRVPKDCKHQNREILQHLPLLHNP